MPQLLDLFGSTGALLAVILGFGFLIFVHELGHFLAAKWVGIKVTQFAIGFGPAMLAWRKGVGTRLGSTEKDFTQLITKHLQSQGSKLDAEGDALHASKLVDQAVSELKLGETEYRLNWLPLGGYVKMLGQEDMDPTAVSSDPRSFNTKPVWARALVISAGVVMNLIFGILFFIVAFMAGVSFPPAIVGDVAPNSAAATTYAAGRDGQADYLGLRSGDRIMKIDDVEVTDFMQVAVATALADPGQTLRLQIEREGEPTPLTYEVKPQRNPNSGPTQGLLTLGVMSPPALKIAEQLPTQRLPDSWVQAGVQPGMTVTHVDEKPITRFDQLSRAVETARGQQVLVTFSDEQSGQTIQVPWTAELLLPRDADLAGQMLGVRPVTLVRSVVEGSPAQQANVQAGDLLLRVGDAIWPSVTTTIDTIRAAQGQPIKLSVWREGARVDLSEVTPDRQNRLGIALSEALDHNFVALVSQERVLGSLNLPAGSRLIQIDDFVINSLSDLQRWLEQQASAHPQGFQANLTYELSTPDRPRSQTTLRFNEQDVQAILSVSWVMPHGELFDMLRVPVAADDPWNATLLGLRKTHEFMMQTYITLLRLFQGTVEVEHLRGPVGIADEGTKVAQQGWPYLMFFLGLISVNLVVINFLPMPIVDGGLMVFLLMEKITGKPISPKIQAASTIVGLVLIGSLFLVVTFNDLVRLFFI